VEHSEKRGLGEQHPKSFTLWDRGSTSTEGGTLSILPDTTCTGKGIKGHIKAVSGKGADKREWV